MRSQRPNYGSTGHRYAEQVKEAIDVVGAESVLDFGCGNQSLKDVLPSNVSYEGYDPGHPEYQKMPGGEFDLVVAIDVMEHVEPQYTRTVLDEIYQKAGKAVYLMISTVKAQAILPDGRNAHINLQSADEWLGGLQNYEWEHWSAVTGEDCVHFYGFKPSTPES